jgi:hypothetical protein
MNFRCCLFLLAFYPGLTALSQELEVVTSKFMTGAVSEEYQINRKGKLDGYYKRFYPEGAVNVEATFSDNQPVGTFLSRHPNGHPAVTGTYREGRKEGRWTYSGPDSLMTISGNFKNDLREGIWTYRHPDGYQIEVNYRSDKPDGSWKLLAGDTLLASCNFTDGKPDRKSMALLSDSVYLYEDSLYRAPDHSALFALLNFSDRKLFITPIPGEQRFLSGLAAINTYLNDFVKIPPSAYPSFNSSGNTRNTCYVQMTVSPFGTIDEVKVLQGFSRALDKEIIREVMKMPLWIPAINRNIPVPSVLTVKYTFQTFIVR